MKKFWILLAILVFLMLGATIFVGFSSTYEALAQTDFIFIENEISNIQDRLRGIYNTSEGNKEEIEAAASAVDRLKGFIVRQDVVKKYSRSVVFNLMLVTLLSLGIWIVMWIVTNRRMIIPLEHIIVHLRKLANGEEPPNLELKGLKEIGMLQNDVNTLAHELVEYKQQIRSMERKQIGRFLVHQIRNSLTPVKLCAHVIKDSFGTQADEPVSIILQESEKIEDLITRFRYMYKFPEPAFIELDVQSLFNELKLKYPPVDFIVAKGSSMLQGDKNLLYQAFVNLIDNALDAVSDNPGGKVMCTFSGSEGIFEITDNGAGIAEENRDRIFNDYFTTKQNGMGIGLSFVKQVMDIHGFSITFISREGHGTTVKVAING